jgi:hypothetical protein
MNSIKTFYRREIVTLLSISICMAALLAIVHYRDAITSAVFSHTGLLLACFLAAAIDLGLVIKIHFRLVVIRYYEKDVNLRLFQD